MTRRADATPDALFAVDEADRRLSFAAYRDHAERCAAGLQDLGVGEGTPVSWMLPTRLDAMILAGALSRLGARQNPVLPHYRHRELRFITGQSGARLLAVPGSWRGFDYAAMAREIAAERDDLDVLVVDGALPEADPARLAAPGAPPRSGEDAPVRWLFYTSGTTADPKGALHTDTSLMAAAQGMCAALELASDDRVGFVFPFTHVGGLVWMLAALRSGCGHIVVEAFDPATSIDTLARHGVTQATAGTVFHQAYLSAQRERKHGPSGATLFPDVRAFPGGGAPKPPALHHDVKRELGGAGIVSGYGMTECPIASMNSVRDQDDKLAHTEGIPRPDSMQIRVVTRQGRTAAAGVEGEIRVRGPQLFRGYLDPTLDAPAFDEDGFLRTGDLGLLDPDGYLIITGRLKDLIIRKGENISAKEVEDLLYTHPKVADVAVIGLPDPASGERCCAVVQGVEHAAALGFEEMADFLRERGLARQKIPEQLERVADLPRNATGKVLKQKLRERFADGNP